jgi:hypothetical protein
MPTPAVPETDIRDYFKQWVDAGRPEITAFARATGKNPSTASRWLRQYATELGLEAEAQQAAVRGFAPDHDLKHPVTAPFVVERFTNEYTDGQLTRQWVKGKLDGIQRDIAIRAAIDALTTQMPRFQPTARMKTATLDHLCTLYTLTDCHVGMKAWAPETGADWDLEIAERTLCGAIRYLVETSPASTVGFLSQLGDFLHFDGLAAVTPTSGHLLDADSRYSKVIGTAIRILRYTVALMLTKHAKVVVLMAEGNHDIAGSLWLRHIFAILFENEPRVEVITTEMPYYVYVHGQVMLAFHHGHLKKNDQLPLLFAAQYAREWGSCTKRYCHTGHLHHAEEKEHAGMTVVQHTTIAARDSYATRYGWIADSSMTAIVYHRDHGKAATITVTPEMLELEAA